MKSLRDRLQKLRSLPSAERACLVRSWCALLGIEVALRCLPFTRVASFCQRLPATGNTAHVPALPPVTRLAWLVTVAGRHSPLGTSCLKEALALSWLMSREGLPTTLRIGVARHHDDLGAHAWLEHKGRIILGGTDADAYAPFPPIPREAVHS